MEGHVIEDAGAFFASGVGQSKKPAPARISHSMCIFYFTLNPKQIRLRGESGRAGFAYLFPFRPIHSTANNSINYDESVGDGLSIPN